MSLYEATKDLHHACEAHALGGRMSKGNVTPQEWADWLWAFRWGMMLLAPLMCFTVRIDQAGGSWPQFYQSADCLVLMSFILTMKLQRLG